MTLGCPLAPALFICAMESLAQKRWDRGISGIQILGGDRKEVMI